MQPSRAEFKDTALELGPTGKKTLPDVLIGAGFFGFFSLN